MERLITVGRNKWAWMATAVGLVAATVWGASPLDDAAAYWSMADAKGGAAGMALQVKGAVALGEALTGAEREASLARGGDGLAARFDGGYLALADDAALKLNPKQWTLAIRMRDPQGTWRYPILGSYGSDKTVSFALRAVDIASKPMMDRNYVGSPLPTIEAWLSASGGPRAVPGASLIEAVWGAKETDSARSNTIKRLQPKETWPNPLEQDVMNAVMRVNFPVGLTGPTEWHDIVVAMTGPKLELWIDGVLVDEEFPIGETRPRAVPFLIGAGQEQGGLKSGFKGLVDHVALWERALSPAEIAAVSGGAEHVRQRELAILGDESPSMQYFRPRGHNRKAGDCIPYWDEQSGTFRLFYLILRRNMHSKWDGGHGGLEIWQASTKDLTSWTHHPVTIPITEQWEAWNGTGAVAFHNGQCNWFYPTPHYEGPSNGIQRAVSKDGVTFTKAAPHPFMPGGDLEIFKDDKGLFNLVKAGPEQRARTQPLRNKTLVAWVRLSDLDQRGGSVLTIEHPDAQQFDALVFGENAPGRWMPGSDRHARTPGGQQAWPEESAAPDTVVQMALVFDGTKGTVYRNGTAYAAYTVKNPIEFPSGSSLLIGLRHTLATPGNSLFHGRVLDARLYDGALSVQQLAELKPDAEGGPKPAAWYDFAGGSVRDRAGTFPDGMLFSGARVENGELVLENGGYFKVPGLLYTQVRSKSSDLETWTEQPGAFIASDKRLAICPNVFKFGGWHYYICGSGVWKSQSGFGPWTEHVPQRLDNLAVPKTGAFGKDRRIYAGFLGDDGWGGNEVLREVVQDADGNLGTRFVRELIPATGAPLKVNSSVRVEATDKRGVFDLPNIPHDYRLQMEVVPESGAKSFGVGLRAGMISNEDAVDLVFRPAEKHAAFSKMGNSSGKTGGGPGIDAVKGLDKPFAVDIIVRHDIIDAEIGGFRSLVTRFWNPAGDRIRLFADTGVVTFRNIRVSPLAETYKPYPGWTMPAAALASNADATPVPLKNDTSPHAAALFSKLFASPQPKYKVTPEEGIGFDDKEHSFQDPSNVIKVGDTYYAWVSWRPLNVHLYNSVIHYATSKDGKKWEQKGLALGKGAPGSWDDWGVLTPYVAEASGRFYMFYTGSDRNFLKGSGNAIGLAVADKPDGPWTRVYDKPVLAPSTDPKAWDSHINDDAHVIRREGKFWMYYKGHRAGRHWTLTQQGVAIADKIEGPYLKVAGNPVIKSGHCCCVWPHAEGVAAISDIQRELLWAKDGLHFVALRHEDGYPSAGPGPYDPDAHVNATFGRGITWGLTQWGDPSGDNKGRNIIARFDMDLRARDDAGGALSASVTPAKATTPPELVLNYHLMHPGGDSAPGDPNAAFYLDGIYHLHYIIAHTWQGKDSFSFVHVTSPDMLHWTWQPTKLQPSFTGHGMFSGTGFITKEGKPAAIYHGQGSGRNQIVIAKDNQLSAWEKPYPIEVKDANGNKVALPQGDPDLFLIGDTYFSIAARFGGTDNPPLMKSRDLKNWTHVGDFIKQFPPDVIIGEDNSCANFFPLGNKWILLTISHLLGCRYYIGEWDAKAEQFVPEQHGRMNWRSEDDPIGEIWEDFFAPETVLTPDGRRVMWTWLANPRGRAAAIRARTIQSLPRELSLPADGILRIKPLLELESLRTEPVVQENIPIPVGANPPFGTVVWKQLARLPGEAVEIRLTIPRDQAARKRFGFRLFGEGKIGGLPIILRPETGTIRVGTTEAPFAVADLPAGEDVHLRIFVDKYLVEVFANDRRSVVVAHMDWRGKTDLEGWSSGAPTTIKKLELWRLKPTNQGFREAQKNHIWEPDTK